METKKKYVLKIGIVNGDISDLSKSARLLIKKIEDTLNKKDIA